MIFLLERNRLFIPETYPKFLNSPFSYAQLLSNISLTAAT